MEGTSTPCVLGELSSASMPIACAAGQNRRMHDSIFHETWQRCGQSLGKQARASKQGRSPEGEPRAPAAATGFAVRVFFSGAGASFWGALCSCTKPQNMQD